MSTGARVAGFLVALGLVFAAATWLGRLADLDQPAGTGHDAHPAHEPEDGTSEGGPVLELATTSLEPGRRQLAFTVEQDGVPLTEFAVSHEKRLHLVAVREDFTGFQHVHPEMDADGRWTVDLQLRPGPWRVYADFQQQGGEATTLTEEIEVSGVYDEAPARADTRTATVDGYTVTLEGDLVAGGSSVLTPRVKRSGVDVTDQLQPYLGARGHLVALRRGDMAYLHVHPDGLDFHTEVPAAETYELFLDFRHDGVVRTAHFTLTAQEAAPTGQPSEEGHHDH